jgi:hypothetical protein
MPSGDAQRTWFPEMVDTLRREWHEGMSIAELVRLRERLDSMLQSIRSERKIRSPLMKCPKCGKRRPAVEPRVSVRAMVLSLSRFGIVSPTEARSLERAWVRYQRENGLDIDGAYCSPDTPPTSWPPPEYSPRSWRS